MNIKKKAMKSLVVSFLVTSVICMSYSLDGRVAPPAKLKVFFEKESINNYISFKDPKSSLTLELSKEKSPVLNVNYNIIEWGGMALGFKPPRTLKQSDTLYFLIKGDGKKNSLRVEITDTGGERFESIIPVDFSGWKAVSIPLTKFTRRKDWQPDKVPDDGLTLTAVEGIGFSPIKGSGAWSFEKFGVIPK